MKKILSIILTLAILVSSISNILVFASDESTALETGDTVVLYAFLSDNPGVSELVLSFEYDSSAMNLVKVTNGEAMNDATYTGPKNLASGCMATWYYIDEPDYFKDGSLVALEFEIVDSAAMGNTYPLSVVIVSAEGASGTVFDLQNNIRVIDYRPGDVNGDGIHSLRYDVSEFNQYIVDGCKYDPLGYAVQINENAADVNNDGVITIKDVIDVNKYIVDGGVYDPNGYAVKLYPHIEVCKHTSLTAVPAKEATCTEDGHIAYWTCSDCGKYFGDAGATNEITLADTVLSVEHQTTHTAAKEATTYADGNIEYWTCSTCGKLFSDSAYENEIELIDTIIQKLTGNTYTVYFKDAQTGKATFVSLDNQETSVSSITKDKSERYDFPQIKKYGFSALCLTDGEGNIITGIEAGTTGNIDVYVHWMSNRNQTRPVKELGDPQIIEDKENGQIFFVYEIGEIDNVPIETIYNVGEIDAGLTHEKQTVKVKNTATQNATSIAETVSNATTKSASMTLSNDWTTHYSIDEEWALTQDEEQVENLKQYVENGGQWNISSQFGGEDTYTDTSGTSTSSTHKSTTGKVFSIGGENGGSSESGHDASITASIKGKAIGVELGVSGEISSYQKDGSNWKSTNDFENSSGTENSKETTTYNDISESYSNNWNTEEGYSQSHNIGTETDISNALRTAITQNSKKSYSDEYSESSLTTESQNITHNEGREYSSAITFSTSEEITDSTTTTLTFKTKGFYRYIRAGKLDVYAVVGYDIKNNTYSVSTFSMFENETKEMWDFSEDGTFADGEIGVLPFEVPYEVEEYIHGETAYTNGLEFNYAQGAVTRYVGDAKNVLIPNYYTKNGNMTYVKTLGIDPQTNKPLFAGNENIEVVRLSKYITSIPDGAFEGCTNLKTVIAPGVTSIGANAFNGCENLNKFIVSTKVTDLGENAFVGCPEVVVNASNSSVARAATTAGATRITINVEEMNGAFTDNEYADGYTINIGNIEYFAFYGGGKTFNNVKLVSGAETTYIEKAIFTSDSGISLNINSENITFKGVNVKNDNVAMLSQFDGAKILIAEDSTFGALTDDNTTKVIVNNIELSNNAGETAQWIIDGTLYVCGNTEFTGKYIAIAKAITTLSKTEFDNYVTGVFNVAFNPNGGSVATTSKSVTYGSAYGTLPTPTRTGYTFTRWTLSTDDATINENSVVSTPADHTLIARWNANSYTVKFNTNGGVCSTPSKTVTYNSTYGDMPIPTRDGHTFTGWYTAKTGGTKITSTTKVSITDEQTLYAQWTANTYTVTFNGNGGTPSKSSQSVTYGGTYGTLPTASKDYYDFNGWYTAASGGTKITSSSTYNTAGNITLYAQWTIHPVSDWVLESAVPSGAQIVSTKYKYTLTTTASSSSPTMSGFTQTSSEWVKSSSGTHKYVELPNTFDTSNSLYTKYNLSPTSAYDNGSEKLEISSIDTISYIYWHWSYPIAGGKDGDHNRLISTKKTSYYNQFEAFESTTNATSSNGNGTFIFTGQNAWSENWYKYPVYQQNWNKFTIKYNFKKTEQLESTSYPTASNSAQTVSNIQKYVKYRAK